MNGAWNAWEQGAINIHSRIILKYKGERVETTMGRIIFNRTVNDVLDSFDITDEPFINRVLGKKQLGGSFMIGTLSMEITLLQNWQIS